MIKQLTSHFHKRLYSFSHFFETEKTKTKIETEMERTDIYECTSIRGQNKITIPLWDFRYVKKNKKKVVVINR